jgi:carbonic anhydrase
MHDSDPTELFADVLEGNRAYSKEYQNAGLEARASKGLAVITCMDSRIDPLKMLGLSPGEAKILRNAGARVTDDVLRTLVLAHYLLGVMRIMVVAHTHCRMTAESEATVHEAIHDAGGPDTRSLSFLTSPDQRKSLIEDVHKVRSYLYLTDVAVEAFLYDLETGELAIVDSR